MNPILVTGGAGFIGSCFVRDLIEQGGREVITLDKLSYAGNLQSLAPLRDDSRHHFVRGDIADRQLVANLLQQRRPQAVVNFAAESHVDRSIEAPTVFAETNVLGVVALLDVVLDYWRRLPHPAREEFRFLQASTDEVYGSIDEQGKSSEEHRYAPNSPYAASKAAADHFVRAYGQTFGLPVLITHSSNNYGPYQHPEKLVPLMILNASEGRALPVYGDGGNIRDWLHVRDHCRAVQAVLASAAPGQRFNIGGDCPRANLEVVQFICDLVDQRCPDSPLAPRRSLIQFVADRPGHDRRYAVDCSKLRRELGWRPHVSFSQGMRETVAWYLEHPDWARAFPQGSEDLRARRGLHDAAESLE